MRVKHDPLGFLLMLLCITLQDENIHAIKFSDLALIGQIHGIKY